MAKNKKDKDAVVKIDSSLLEEVEKFLEKEENKFKFLNKKHFVDLAVSEFLAQQKNPKHFIEKYFPGGGK